MTAGKYATTMKARNDGLGANLTSLVISDSTSHITFSSPSVVLARHEAIFSQVKIPASNLLITFVFIDLKTVF